MIQYEQNSRTAASFTLLALSKYVCTIPPPRPSPRSELRDDYTAVYGYATVEYLN